MWKLIFSLLVVCSSAVAEIEIIDDGKFDNMSMFHKGQFSFEQAFECGAEQKFRSDTVRCQYKCGSACVSRCDDAVTPIQKKFTLAIEECSSDRVMVYGDNGFVMEVLRADYERGGNTLIVPLLKAHGFFLTPEATVTMGMVISQSVKIIANGIETQRFASVFSANVGVSPQGQGFGVDVVYFPEEPGLKSLAMFRSIPDTHFLRRNDVRKTYPDMDW